MRPAEVTVLQHLMAILNERHQQYTDRFRSHEENVRIALTSTERRFESVNEFRQTLSDQAATFATRDQLEAMRTLVAAMAARLDRQEGRSTGLGAGWGYLVAAAGVVIAVVALVIR
jgi:hypothetical protein